ncbi:SDR family NAD(P)-dependent oxidoreductase [Chthonobacter albigriseus]|uniref:SDR family NAD(P)-dependent oxidoreductase n=1 Tax=Chthonobacter albigriseus TaxID=1683161 RepID=UPI0015EF95D7|nr:SDR family oxidoreductase [Chthonobacter albigriseus]
MTDRTIIYGGTGGIGSEIARALARAGRAVHLVARDGGRLAALGAEIGCGVTEGDVTDPATFDRVVQDVGDSPVAGLVYAVGTITLKPLARLTDADYLSDFTLNALGAARAVRAHLPAMQRAASGASVVLFSSVAARQGFANHASIAMAKGAVEGLVLSLGAELAPKVRVNAVAPSLTDTPLAAGMTSNEAMVKAIAGLHALPRIGTPVDIAGLAVFLLGEGASWITGQVIGVDGGRSTLRTKG